MKNYISMEMVKAEPATAVDGRIYVGEDIPVGNEVEHGFKLYFANGAESFCDKEDFEKFFFPLDINKDLKTDKPSISEQMVDNFIARFYGTTVGDKTTVVRAVLVNGFEIVESSSCVSPENYDEEIGISVCIDKIRDKVWELLGFLLATAVNGFDEEIEYLGILHEEMKDSLDGEEEKALPLSDLPEALEVDPRSKCAQFPLCPDEKGCDICGAVECSCRIEIDKESSCEEACGVDDCGDPMPQTPYNPGDGPCPSDVDSEKKENKPVSISIEENEGGAFEIHMEGDSDKATVALEMAMSSLFVSEYAHLDADMQLILADNMAARIGRGVRSMIMAGAKTEKE